MINLSDQMRKRNEWLWENRGRKRQTIAYECGISESRVKHILVEIRKEKGMTKFVMQAEKKRREELKAMEDRELAEYRAKRDRINARRKERRDMFAPCDEIKSERQENQYAEKNRLTVKGKVIIHRCL
jgi:hypothetical protein